MRTYLIQNLRNKAIKDVKKIKIHSIREWHGREEEEEEEGEEGREEEAYLQARGRSPAGRRWVSISSRASFRQQW